MYLPTHIYTLLNRALNAARHTHISYSYLKTFESLYMCYVIFVVVFAEFVSKMVLHELCVVSGLWRGATTASEMQLTLSNRFWRLWR